MQHISQNAESDNMVAAMAGSELGQEMCVFLASCNCWLRGFLFAG
jgi:hypothetical protein